MAVNPGREQQRHAQDAPADVVNAVRRRSSTDVSAVAGWTWMLRGLTAPNSTRWRTSAWNEVST
jgi:hypothetical protein